LDKHPTEDIIATGEVGPKPWIHVWDASTMEVKCSLKGTMIKGIASLKFSPSGKKLVGACIDDDHHIGVFDISSETGNLNIEL